MLQILMKTFENNGKSISENFVKLNLKQNLFSFGHHMCRGNRFLTTELNS